MATAWNPVGNAKRCTGCQNPVYNKCVWAMGGLCHVDCLVCSQCKKDIVDPLEARMDHQQVKCLACFNNNNGIAPCGICSKPINDVLEKPIQSGGKQFHQQCFQCKACGAALSPGWYFAYHDDFFCNGDCIQHFDKNAMEVFRPTPPPQIAAKANGAARGANGGSKKINRAKAAATPAIVVEPPAEALRRGDDVDENGAPLRATRVPSDEVIKKRRYARKKPTK